MVVTAALPYANGEIHLGHVASTYLPADIFARYCRLKGRQVIFVSGTDDYGTPILIAAEEKGVSPEEFVKYWHDRDEEDFKKLGISFDLFYQTHSPENVELAQQFFLSLLRKGYIFDKDTEQWFCPNCKRFLPDRYVKGTCPYCGARDQYSDACEVCGRAIEPGKIIDPRCAICGTPPIRKKSKHYFFKLSAFSSKLKDWLESNENLQKDVKKYVLEWIREGLKDWDITRDIPWGVPIPLKEAKGKVLYGWFDNHLGYISFTLKALKEKGMDGREFWNSAKIYHFIGKDIVYHHYLFLPAMRLAEGNYKLPDFIPTRGHLLLQGKKFSKSRKWYISLRDVLERFPADYLRYYLASITPYSQKDANFDLEEFKAKINNELVANIGNMVHRVLTFIYRRYEGRVPEPASLDETDERFTSLLKELPREVEEFMESLEFDKALKKVRDFCAECNRYFQLKKPWEEDEEAKTCLYLTLNAVKGLAIVLKPFIPNSMEKLWFMLGLEGSVHSQRWDEASELTLKPGHRIRKPEILFKRIKDEDIEYLRSQLSSPS